MIIGLQIIALLFAFCMIYFAVLHYKRREINGMEILSWLIMWVLAIVVIIFPELLKSFAGTFLVTRVFDLMVIAGFILVISMVANAYVRTKKLEKRLEDLVRKEALKGKANKQSLASRGPGK
jgi:hypothetical protein